MKRPEHMAFWAYRTALKRLNDRIDAHLSGDVLYRGHKPYRAEEWDLRVKPLAVAVRSALG